MAPNRADLFPRSRHPEPTAYAGLTVEPSLAEFGRDDGIAFGAVYFAAVPNASCPH